MIEPLSRAWFVQEPKFRELLQFLCKSIVPYHSIAVISRFYCLGNSEQQHGIDVVSARDV